MTEMIHNIIHISDIHIRNGDTSKSRYTEYISTFDNLHDSIAQQPSIQDKSAVIVLTGDIFHDKNKIGSSGIKIATYLLQKLSKLATVFVIRGNHDYRQDHPTELDMISALMSYDIHNVIYLDTTGNHIYKNISFGLVAIQDTLLYGSTSGISRELPDFPKPTSDSNYKIALFHGTIKGCTLQNGTKSTIDGYPIDWFQGYDAILLGDIHLQQITRAKLLDNQPCSLPFTSIYHTYKYDDEVPWGYPGSLIQQDFGEPIKGHGYILWNLQNKEIKTYHVKNNYGMIKLYWNDNIDDILIDYKQYTKPITKVAQLHKIISTKWFPDNLHVRVLSDNITPDNLRLITEKIQSYGKKVISITRKKQNDNKVIPETETNENNSTEIQNINSKNNLIEYIQKNVEKDNITFPSDKWKQWLLHPETISIPPDAIPESLRAKITTKNTIVEKSAQKYSEEFEKVSSQQIITGKLTIHKLEWSWILNYKNGNVFDFDRNTRMISVLNAKNANGKSNFLEIICIALFGEGFPSRHNSNYTANIICDKKPSGVMGSTRITFTLNDKIYIIERTLRNNSNKRSINFEDVILYKVVDEVNEILHQKNNAVSKWIEINIGKCDTYLMSAMLSQNADSDFFTLDHKKQKELLDRILALDHINSLEKLIDDSVKYFKSTSELIESYSCGISNTKKEVEPKLIQELEELRNQIQHITTRNTELHSKWNMVAEKDLLAVSDIHSVETEIAELEQQISPKTSDSRNNIQVLINDYERSIRILDDKLSRLRSVIYLIDNANPTENADSEYLDTLDLRLRSHPFYKSAKLDEPLHIISQKINDAYKNDFDNQELFRSVQNFQTWNKIQIENFSHDKKYFQDKSQITNLEKLLKTIIKEIDDFPEKIRTSSKKCNRMRMDFNKINKEKELCSDKRPNKPVRGREWLAEITRKHTGKNLETLLKDSDFIQNSIQHISIISHNIQVATEKIEEYQEYITECSNLPFNPKCEACKKQPWKMKLNTIQSELGGIITRRDKEVIKLKLLEYDGITHKLYDGIPNAINYTKYILELRKCLEDITLSISEIQQVDTETESWKIYDVWLAEYDQIRNQCDALNSEINSCELEKRSLEDAFEVKKNERIALETKLENIRKRNQEYDLYVAELAKRQFECDEAQHKLEYNWNANLYEYRVQLTMYVNYINAQRTRDELGIKECKERMRMILERERCEEKRNLLRSIYFAYPSWHQWKDGIESEKGIALRIREIECELRNGGSGGDKAVDGLVNGLKTDIEMMTYLSVAFKGYKQWLYKENIGPVIQRNVNAVLDLICDERPLYLECDYLQAIDTLTWFIRDGSSRPVIQKASGFQRFIVGIAMRVAINQIGLCRMRYSELFIDEGFTACDTENLERVPEFLRGLLRFYGSIYLATHLEDLKGCADEQIFIRRDDSGLSLIQHGDAEAIRMVEEASKSKKRGRPVKANLVITRV